MWRLSLLHCKRPSGVPRPSSIAYVVGLICLLWSFRARADAARPFRVEFHSTAGCGDVAEFSRELLQRTSRLRPARADEPALTIGVDLWGAEPRIEGRVTMPLGAGPPLERRVSGVDCHEVLGALVLIVWVRLDVTPEPAAEVAVPANGSKWSGSVGQRVTLQTGVMPNLALGEEGYGELGYTFTRYLAPSLRVAFHVARSRPVGTELGHAAFDWWSTRTSLCPLRWPASSWLDLRPCASLDAGSLKGTGYAIRAARSATVFWSAVGLSVSFRARLGARLAAGLETGALFPTIRDTYKFDPSVPIYRVPNAGFQLGVGISALFF